MEDQPEEFQIDPGVVIEKLSSQVKELSVKSAMQEAAIDQLQAELTHARSMIDRLGKEKSNGTQKRETAAKG